MQSISESDWKTLRKLKEAKLNQLCGSFLHEIKEKVIHRTDDHYRSFYAIWELVNAGNDDVADMFDDLKRSNAIFKLALWRRNGLLSDDELNEFSAETRSATEFLCKH